MPLKRKRMTVLIDDIYDAFLTRVAKGRNMSKEEVRQVAKGRAWTGAQAKEKGLVDALGGLNFAFDRTAMMLEEGTTRHDLNIIQIPRPKTPLEEFITLLGQQVHLGAALQGQTKWMEQLTVLFQRFEILSHAQEYGIYDADLEALR